MRRADRLRGRDVDGLDHRGHVCGGLLPCGDACDRQLGRGQGVGFGAHRPQPLPRLLPAGGEQPLVPEPAHRRRRPCGETVPRADEPRLLHADRHGAHRAVRSGDGRCRRRFRPSDGPLPLRGQRHEPPPSGGAAAGRAERGGALLDVHSPGVQARGGGFDAALRRRHLRQLPVEAARRDVRSRFHRGIGLHLGQHPAQRRQQHHGPGFHAGHAGDRLHAARGAQRHDPPGRGCRDARLRPGRGHHGLGLRGRHGRHARNPAAGRRTPRRDRLRRAPRRRPREVSPADFQRLPARGADADPAGLYPRLRAGGPPHAGTPAADGVRRAARQPLRGAGRGRVLDGIPPRALRFGAAALRLRGAFLHAPQLPDHRRRQHLLDGLQPGLRRYRPPVDRPRRTAAERRAVPRGRSTPGAHWEAARTSIW